MKKLRNLLTLLVVSICAVQSAWAQDEEQSITVTLRESGGLATEIFTEQANQGYAQNVATVTNLTVTSGELNAADWTTIQGMDQLKTLDLSGTNNKEIPANQFKGHNANLTIMVFPSSIESIGEYAFNRAGNLVTAVLPSTVKSVGTWAFGECSNLEDVGTWPSGASIIPRGCFFHCGKLFSFTIPEGVTEIGEQAFSGCSSFSSTIPSTMQTIGDEAFRDNAMQDIDVVLPEGISIGTRAFSYTNIKSIVFPSSYCGWIGGIMPLENNSNLKDVTLMSPTVIGRGEYYSSGNYLGSIDPNSVTLHVPNYLVNEYKSDSYFYQFNIEGFDITEHDLVWPINYSLTLNSYTRMAGEPKISLGHDVVLNITGDDAQKFGEITLKSCLFGHWLDSEYMYKNWTQILSTCENVSVTGNYYQNIKTDEKKWYFICLPFDVDLSAITTEDDAKYAIRYYDGESRAYNNSSNGNWKNFAANAVIPAGTGFIYQTSKTTWTTFKAVNNDTRNNVFKNEEIVTALAKNDVTEEGNTLDAANKGWNLIGNPWQCYYDIFKMNYTAPICVYDGSTYVTYSIQDDDFALEPNQAFFVQCPDALNSISFPADGRQLTNEINRTNRASRVSASDMGRWLLDVQIENGAGQKDKTRLVVNNQAQMDYEIGTDASKFISTEGTVPQIYSLDANKTQYAINERPLDNGTLRLGLIIKEKGIYSISAIRNDVGQVLLTDNETGIITDLSQNGYSFNAEAGSFEARFILSFMSGEVTGIANMKATNSNQDVFFNLNGQRVNNPQKGVYIVGGKKVMMK